MRMRSTLSRRIPLRAREFVVTASRPALGQFVVRIDDNCGKARLSLAPARDRRFSDKVLYIGRLGGARR